jgi:hypothetical protein
MSIKSTPPRIRGGVLYLHLKHLIQKLLGFCREIAFEVDERILNLLGKGIILHGFLDFAKNTVLVVEIFGCGLLIVGSGLYLFYEPFTFIVGVLRFT